MTVQFTSGSAPFCQTYSPGDHDATSLSGRCTDPQPLHAPDSSLLLPVGLSLDPFFVHSPICMKFLWRRLCVRTLCLEVGSPLEGASNLHLMDEVKAQCRRPLMAELLLSLLNSLPLPSPL